MRLTWRDGVATLLMAAIAVPYIGYLAGGSTPFIHDARGMAIAALVLGAAACYTGDLTVLARRWTVVTVVTVVLGVAVLGLAIAAVVTASGAVLAAFISTLLVLWAVATFRHAGLSLPAGGLHMPGAAHH